MKKNSKILIILIFISSVLYGQFDSTKLSTMTREEILQLSQDDLLEMSMEDLIYLANKMGISIDDLLNMKTSVASGATYSSRETPGIVSIITKEEIKSSGARDLIDVLRLVPGFDFGYDVQGVVGQGLRGNWVHEGKILMMVDGQPVNESSYFNIPFGNHFPVDQIKRVEIIRGPGSAIYGGNAELGVINIITKKGADIQGVEFTGTYGQMQHSMGRANLNVNSGFTAKDWDISAKAFIGKANRSDQLFTEYIDDPDNVIDLSEGGSEIGTRQAMLAATNQKLSINLLYDDYRSRYYYYADSATGNESIYNEFRTMIGEIKYHLKINEKLSLIPKFSYKFGRPYYEQDYWRNFRVNRYTGNLLLQYELSETASLVTGVEWLTDKGHCIYDSGYFYSNNSQDMRIDNLAGFAEASVKWNKLNLVGGFRAEHNSEFGWAMAPRLGATSVLSRFHFKVLLSGAFRSPGIGNIDISKGIEPEKSFVSEFEIGYRISDYMFVTANVFDIKISNSITYYDNGGWEPGVDWGYKNSDNAGSDGFELEFKAMHPKGYATVNYAFYTQALRSIPELYSVLGHENSALGLAQHKIGINLNYRPVPDLSIGPSLVILGKKYGYTSVDEEGNPLISGFDPSFLMNLAVNYDNLFHKGFSIGLAAFDLLNEKPVFIQPYNGWFSPYPGRSREILVKITLSTDLFKKEP
jgi:outer membrane receptor for ferrienterochelin and colicin